MEKLRNVICWCPGLNTEPAETGPLDLIALQPKLILDSWNSIKNKISLGQSIFKRVFFYKPALRNSFGLQGISNDVLETQPVFKSHAANFVDFLNVAVLSIKDHDRSALRKARCVGILHARIANSNPTLFDPEFWMLFVNSAIEEIAHAQRSPLEKSDVQSAWQMLLLRLVMEMKVGFYMELIRSADFRCLTESRPGNKT